MDRYSPSAPSGFLPDEDESYVSEEDIAEAAASEFINLANMTTDEVFHDAAAHQVDSDARPDGEVQLEVEILVPDAIPALEKPLPDHASSSDDGEGEIDMDLGMEDELEVIPAAVIEPQTFALMEEEISPVDALPIPEVPSAVPADVSPVIHILDDTPIKPVQDTPPPVARRPPGQQRRSPSYSLDAKPVESVTSKAPAPTPTSASLPPRAGLPQKPVTNVNSLYTNYAPNYDLTGAVWPESISANSSSVVAHLPLAASWRDSKDNLAARAQASLALLEAARSDGDIEGVRAWYQIFAAENPTAIGPMLDLINLELAHGNFTQVVTLYEKALRGLGGSVGAVPGVDIWRSYLHYIRRQNPIPAPGSAAASTADAVRETVVRAYELALKEAGVDVASGDIWREYIAFLSEKECTNTWEAQTQNDAIRKVYQRAVVIPLLDVEQIWREYDAFENKLNKMTAKKFLAERSPLYMTARTVLRDLRVQLEPLTTLPIPPRPTRSETDRALVINWKKYLKWEESNPLDLDEPAALQARIGYALKKCLTQMRFFPELWHQAAGYWIGVDKVEDGISYLRTGLEANSSSFLLTFALAEQEEVKKDHAGARKTYEALINIHGEEIEKLKSSIHEQAEEARGPEIEADEVEFVRQTQEDDDMDGVELSENQKRRVEREARGQAVLDRRQKEMDDLVTAAGVIWVMFMRFARRAEGLKAARGVFAVARKSPHASWHVFEASANMEFHCNKDPSIATKIYELGLKAFPEDVAFAVKFLEFQIQINDESNARALFERLVLKFPADKARPIWDAWAKYEYLYGDLGASQKLADRMKETYPGDAPLRRFAARFLYNGIDEIASRDLGFGVKRELPPPPVKRSRPDNSPSRSPRMSDGRFRERDERRPMPPREPPSKRQRGFSPPRRDRGRDGRPMEDDGRRRDFSPPPPRREPPPMHQAPPIVPAPIERDPSGLPKAVVWFMGNLPRARLFDGPTFDPADMVDVLSRANIGNNIGKGPVPLGGDNFPPQQRPRY